MTDEGLLVNQQIGIAPAADTLVRRREWRASEPDSIDALQVVYKVAERCNINCSYCYYFHMGDETPLERPAYAPHAVTERLAHWMRSEEHTSELQSLMRISYAGFRLKKNT